MMTTHSLTASYLRRLEHAARALPRSDREELVAHIRAHLDSGLQPNVTEAEVRNLLDELGPPEDIVAAAGPQSAPTSRGPREVFALVLLVSGFPPVLGWLVGVGLLLWSPLWSTRQKLLGILVWPFGYVGVVGVFGGGVFRAEACGSVADVSGTTSSCATPGLSPWWIVWR